MASRSFGLKLILPSRKPGIASQGIVVASVPAHELPHPKYSVSRVMVENRRFDRASLVFSRHLKPWSRAQSTAFTMRWARAFVHRPPLPSELYGTEMSPAVPKCRLEPKDGAIGNPCEPSHFAAFPASRAIGSVVSEMVTKLPSFSGSTSTMTCTVPASVS